MVCIDCLHFRCSSLSLWVLNQRLLRAKKRVKKCSIQAWRTWYLLHGCGTWFLMIQWRPEPFARIDKDGDRYSFSIPSNYSTGILQVTLIVWLGCVAPSKILFRRRITMENTRQIISCRRTPISMMSSSFG